MVKIIHLLTYPSKHDPFFLSKAKGWKLSRFWWYTDPGFEATYLRHHHLQSKGIFIIRSVFMHAQVKIRLNIKHWSDKLRLKIKTVPVALTKNEINEIRQALWPNSLFDKPTTGCTVETGHRKSGATGGFETKCIFKWNKQNRNLPNALLPPYLGKLV